MCMNGLPLLLCIPLTICESQSQPRKHSAISSFSPTPQLETRCQVNIEHHLENCLAQVRSNFGAGQLRKSVDPAAMALTSWAKTSSPGSCCSSRKGTLRASKSLGTSWHILNAGTNSPQRRNWWSAVEPSQTTKTPNQGPQNLPAAVHTRRSKVLCFTCQGTAQDGCWQLLVYLPKTDGWSARIHFTGIYFHLFKRMRRIGSVAWALMVNAGYHELIRINRSLSGATWAGSGCCCGWSCRCPAGRWRWCRSTSGALLHWAHC